MFMPLKTASDSLQRKAKPEEFQLTAPVLNFPKNDIISSSYAGQIANARARVVTGFAHSILFGFGCL
jgi:hypothetical protein